MKQDQATPDYRLPASVVTRADLARLLREVEQVDSELESIALRATVGVATRQSPHLSESLGAFLSQNQLDLKDKRARSELIERLRTLKNDVAMLHLTFSSPADSESLAKIVDWLRQTINPRLVIEVGLQPDLIAGVVVRTENQIHDFSLRQAFRGHADFLVKELEQLRGGR